MQVRIIRQSSHCVHFINYTAFNNEWATGVYGIAWALPGEYCFMSR